MAADISRLQGRSSTQADMTERTNQVLVKIVERQDEILEIERQKHELAVGLQQLSSVISATVDDDRSGRKARGSASGPRQGKPPGRLPQGKPGPGAARSWRVWAEPSLACFDRSRSMVIGIVAELRTPRTSTTTFAVLVRNSA